MASHLSGRVQRQCVQKSRARKSIAARVRPRVVANGSRPILVLERAVVWSSAPRPCAHQHRSLSRQPTQPCQHFKIGRTGAEPQMRAVEANSQLQGLVGDPRPIYLKGRSLAPQPRIVLDNNLIRTEQIPNREVIQERPRYGKLLADPLLGRLKLAPPCLSLLG